MSSKMPIVVSHYTIDTGYEREIEKLVASLDKWKLRYEIEAIDSLPEEDGAQSWRRNSNYCSVLVQKMLRKHPKEDILRVDADAVFQRFPSLFVRDDFDADIAAHIHTFRWHKNELLGGTMFFRNTPTVQWLVDLWAYECMVNRPKSRNGDLLQEIVNSKKFDVKFGELPDTYCKIFDIMRYVKEPVIEHFQASRRFKRRVNFDGAQKR